MKRSASLAIVAALCLPIAGHAQDRCDPAYPGVCIPPAPPDLNCPDIEHRDFEVRPPDPHHFDHDRDGVGCESPRR